MAENASSSASSFTNNSPAATEAERNLLKQFSGKTRFSWTKWRSIISPQRQSDVDPRWPDQNRDLESNKEKPSPSAEPADGDRGCVQKRDGLYRYINQYHEETNHFEDVAVYLSPTRSTPRRLVVQATPYVLEHNRALGDWKRDKLAGSPPFVLAMSEWALSPFGKSGIAPWIKYPMGVTRLLLVAIPLQLVLLIPWMKSWDDSEVVDSYTEFPGYTWEWPKFAVNKLDRRPHGGNNDTLRALDHRYRRRTPDKLWVKKGGVWKLTDTQGRPPPSYLFCSHSWGEEKKGTPEYTAATDRKRRIAQMVAEKEGFEAFWIDQDCFTEEKGQRLSYDIYTICDLVRGSAQVAVIPSEDSEAERRIWGRRMWTFMEGLLAPRDAILFCHDDGTVDRLHKVEAAERYWSEDVENEDPIEGGNPVRLLAEHLTGLVTLTKLEFLSVAITAVTSMERRSQFSKSDVAYATMGLLRYRIVQDDHRTLFQSLAQLLLQNDSDNIIERMICILPRSADTDRRRAAPQSSSDSPTRASPAKEQHATNAFLALQHADQFGTRIHDIKPLCEVAGVAEEDDIVMLDSCRAMHIRWKNFPPPAVERNQDRFRRWVAVVLITAAYWWATNAVTPAVIYTPIIMNAGIGVLGTIDNLCRYLIYGFLGVGFVLAVLAPLSVRRVFSGTITKTSPDLVGFEGTMPISEVEKTFFGNCQDRFSYSPSATPLLEEWRHPSERIGLEPKWVTDPSLERPKIPPGHQMFTLVDIGELTVSIFTAERPPTTALICGREGGMLRVVLCSWRFRNDCLYKETVVRMPSNVLENATAKTWIKVCLKSQDQARRDAVRATKEGNGNK
ncbi:hypothetical protein F4818DRAFT_230421 [Hypoxylon cercidicola]|nr:hypothetical protein F4818DRAFT_230421 [Hypoxylon cercidicola]